MTWQPEPPESSPAAPEGEGPDADEVRGPASVRRRAGRKTAAFAALLAAGLGGLAIAALGIAHQLLPRQFSHRQQTAIATWEMERRWRDLPAGRIFPASVSYQIPAGTLDATTALSLSAGLLAIGSQTTCADAVLGKTVTAVRHYGCGAALRATYVDSSGSMVATVTVMVLPGTAAANAVATDVRAAAAGHAPVEQTFPVSGTAAARFGDGQGQFTDASARGPYVVLATAGFADGRQRIAIRADSYLFEEMTSFDNGLLQSAETALGQQPPVPACPGAPGC